MIEIKCHCCNKTFTMHEIVYSLCDACSHFLSVNSSNDFMHELLQLKQIINNQEKQIEILKQRIEDIIQKNKSDWERT